MRFSVLLLLCLLLGCTEKPQSEIVKQDLPYTITASGELTSQQVAKISQPMVEGVWNQTIKFLMPESAKVNKGDMVASFDDKRVQENLRDSTAELTRVNQELANEQLAKQAKEQELILAQAEAKMQLDKAKRKAEIVDNSRSEIERQKAQIDFTIATNNFELATKRLAHHEKASEQKLMSVQTKLNRVQGKIDQYKRELASLKVAAPIAGVISYVPDWNGNKPTVGANTQMGQVIMMVSVPESMEVVALIDETMSGRVNVNDPVTLTLEGAKAYSFSGKVRALGKVYREKSYQNKQRVIEANIVLDSINTEVLRPGMSVKVEIQSSWLKDSLVVDKQYVYEKAGSTFIKLNGNEHQVTVKHVADTNLVISSGVNVGDRVTL